MKEICRFCGKYCPDERYKGTIGICNKDNNRNAVTVASTCIDFSKGNQITLQGTTIINQ